MITFSPEVIIILRRMVSNGYAIQAAPCRRSMRVAMGLYATYGGASPADCERGQEITLERTDEDGISDAVIPTKATQVLSALAIRATAIYTH